MTTHATRDRGEILHFAGFHHLSPALSERGDPAFSAAPGDGLSRCGWETFFGRMRERGLALSFEPEDGSSARFVPCDRVEEEHPSLASAVEHARRFWAAMFPRKPA
jgi:hypothetical protein